jgi:hypothetical protein
MPLQDEISAAGGVASYAKDLLNKMRLYGEETPVQEEVTQESAPVPATGLAFGMVTQCLDEERAGRIKVQSLKFGKEPQTCDYVSPIAGAGYGLFAVPGIGSVVLVGENPYSDTHAKYFWLGCLYAPGQREVPGLKSQPYIFGKGHEAQMVKTEVDDDGKPLPNNPTVSFGVPNEGSVYQDNDLPDSFVLKHPAGHSISLTDKNSPERKTNEIKIKSAQNKRLILSDAPAEGSGGERITLSDENGNSICIATEAAKAEKPPLTADSINTFAKGNINVDSVEGHIDHTISKKSQGDYIISNAGTGNIDIGADNGHVIIDAKAGITLTCGSCSIKMTPNSINITGPTGDVVIDSTSLNKHTHPTMVGPVPGVTSPPVP